MTGASMLHSVSYAGLWGQAFLSLDQFVDKAAELGYEGVMLMAKRPHLSVLDFGSTQRAFLRRRIDTNNLTAVCIAGYTNFTADLEHGDIPNREIQIHYVTELARLARDLGGNLVRIFTGYDNKAQPYAAQMNLVRSALKECAQRASDFDVILGVQNHHDIAVSTESFHDLICSVAEPNCRAMYDAWAPALHGDDLIASARIMAPLTVHTTVANYKRMRRFHYEPGIVNYVAEKPALQAVPMGEGFIDYKTFLEALSTPALQSIAYEMCSPLRDGADLNTLDRYARAFLHFLDA